MFTTPLLLLELGAIVETLTHASNSNRIMETVYSYMGSGERESSDRQ